MTSLYYERNKDTILQKQREIREQRYNLYCKNRIEYYKQKNNKNHSEYLQEYFKDYYEKIKHIKDINVDYIISFD